MRSVSRFQHALSVAADAGSASAAQSKSSLETRFMIASSESEVHQELDFLLVRGLRIVPADHREPIALSAQASGPLGNPVGGVPSHRPAWRAAGLGDGGDIEVVVVPRGVL